MAPENSEIEFGRYILLLRFFFAIDYSNIGANPIKCQLEGPVSLKNYSMNSHQNGSQKFELNPGNTTRGHRSFSLVDHKVQEAAFFLHQLRDCGFNFFAARCYCSAFVSSSRSITFALQSVMAGYEGFATWYQERQEELRKDDLARFFHQFRTANQHVGENLVNGGIGGRGTQQYFFTPTAELRIVPREDVVTACSEYFKRILRVVYDCYLCFGPLIDEKQRYTSEYFAAIGRTIEDAEEELGFPRGWTDLGDPSGTPCRWEALRRHSIGCEINDLFQEYLGCSTPIPPKLPPYSRTTGV